MNHPKCQLQDKPEVFYFTSVLSTTSFSEGLDWNVVFEFEQSAPGAYAIYLYLLSNLPARGESQ
jgi:hypothetical protein